jgi:hypothetical protein
VDLLTLLEDWHLSLRAANKAPRTIDAFVEAGTKFVKFIGDEDVGSLRSKRSAITATGLGVPSDTSLRYQYPTVTIAMQT